MNSYLRSRGAATANRTLLHVERLENRLLLAGDVFEPNDSDSRASELGIGTYEGLSIHARNDEDWYRWTAPRDGELTVDIVFSNRAGNLDLSLNTARGLPVTSISTTDDEQVTVRATRGTVYYIHVYGARGATNPNYDLEISFVITKLPDTDGDGLLDRWEEFGLDIDQDGIIDLDLPALGARPDRKDLFVEVDAMAGRGPHSQPTPPPEVARAGLATHTVLDNVIDAFLNSPVANPDGTTGIHLHIEVDETGIPVPAEPFSGSGDFYAVKCGGDLSCDPSDDHHREESPGHFGSVEQRSGANWRNVIAAKRMVYRYALFADRLGTNGMSGLAESPGNDLIVTLGDWPYTLPDRSEIPGGSPDEQAGTFMHMLGHTLGLRHGGGDDIAHKPNYFSVMNFHWQVPTRNLGWRLDYSREELPELDENNLIESAGIGFPRGSVHDTEGHRVHVGESTLVRVPLVGPVDWDGDGNGNESGVQADINFDGKLESLKGHNDWENLIFAFVDELSLPGSIPLDCVPSDPDCEWTWMDNKNIYSPPTDAFEPNDSSVEVGELDSDDVYEPLTIHLPQNDDWFEWELVDSLLGVARIDLHLAQDEAITLGLELFDSSLQPVDVLASDPASGRFEFQVSGGQQYLMEVFTTSGGWGYYELEVDAPEIWDGGTAVNSTAWDNPDNWIVNGQTALPDASDNITFVATGGALVIDLKGKRTVNSMTFLDDYTIVGDAIKVSSGRNFVAPGATVTMDADLDGLSKVGEGTLIVNGQVEGLAEVWEGQLGGSGTLEDLLVGPGASVSPGQSVDKLHVKGMAVIHGDVIVEIGKDNSDRLDVTEGVQLNGGSAALHLTLDNDLPSIGSHTHTIISAGSQISGTFNEATEKGHLGRGVFFTDMHYDSGGGQVTIDLFRAAPGDANGDHKFDQFDVVLVLQGGKYLTGEGATWQQGDWDGDNDFDQFDLIKALQTANYLQGAYASRTIPHRPAAG